MKWLRGVPDPFRLAEMETCQTRLQSRGSESRQIACGGGSFLAMTRRFPSPASISKGMHEPQSKCLGRRRIAGFARNQIIRTLCRNRMPERHDQLTACQGRGRCYRIPQGNALVCEGRRVHCGEVSERDPGLGNGWVSAIRRKPQLPVAVCFKMQEHCPCEINGPAKSTVPAEQHGAAYGKELDIQQKFGRCRQFVPSGKRNVYVIFKPAEVAVATWRDNLKIDVAMTFQKPAQIPADPTRRKSWSAVDAKLAAGNRRPARGGPSNGFKGRPDRQNVVFRFCCQPQPLSRPVVSGADRARWTAVATCD